MTAIEKLEQYRKEYCHEAGECDWPLCPVALAIAELKETCEWTWNRRSGTWSVGCDKVARYAPRTHHEYCSHCGKDIKETR